MSSGSRGHGNGSYTSGGDDPRSNGYRTSSYHHNSSHGVRNPVLVPADTDTTSRRRSMNIEDILNPSDENPTRKQQPESPKSVKDDKKVPRKPGSPQGYRHPRSGPLSPKAKASARSQGGSRPPPRGRGSGSPENPSRTRAFRPGYTEEEEMFIWYLRIDCGYSWTAIADAYNARFSQDGQGQRRIPGLQCKFYRITEANGLPHVRAMRRTRDTVSRCGMRAITGHTREDWPWLDGRYPASAAYGHMFGRD